MSIFEAYDQEFKSLSSDISKNVNELRNLAASEQDRASSLLRLLDGLVSQSNDLIKQMEVEVRSHDPATRKVLAEKVSAYKKSFASLKGDYERAKDNSQRSQLIGSKSGSDRQRLLDANDKITRQNEMIAAAHRTVAETEDVGADITAELARNREKIESSRAKTKEFMGVTDSARRLVASMSRREVRQRYLIVFIAAVLITSIAIVIYYTTHK